MAAVHLRHALASCPVLIPRSPVIGYIGIGEVTRRRRKTTIPGGDPKVCRDAGRHSVDILAGPAIEYYQHTPTVREGQAAPS